MVEKVPSGTNAASWRSGQVGLMSNDALRVEPYTTPLKIVPLPDMTGQ